MRVLLKDAIGFYVGTFKALAKSLVPSTHYVTTFHPFTHREYLHISTEWMGQIIQSEVFPLANRPEREKYLKELLDAGHISDEEYKKALCEK